MSGGSPKSLTQDQPWLNFLKTGHFVSNNTLILKGEKRHEEEKKGENFLRVERRYGQFSRTISLATQCSGENLKARFKNGILTVEIPKDEKDNSKRIDRSAARDGISARQLYNPMHKYHLDTKTFKDNPDQTSQESLFSF